MAEQKPLVPEQAKQQRNRVNVMTLPKQNIDEMTEENACDYLMHQSTAILPKQYRKANLKDMRKALDKIAQYDKNAWEYEAVGGEYEPKGKAVKYIEQKYYDPLWLDYDENEQYLRQLKLANGVTDHKPKDVSFKDWKNTWPEEVCDQNRKVINARGKLRRAEQITKFLTLYSTSDDFKRDYDNMLKCCKSINTAMHELYMEPRERSEESKRKNPHMESNFSYSISSRVDPGKISFLLRDSATDTKKSLKQPATRAAKKDLQAPAQPTRGRQVASWKSKLGFGVN